MKLRSTDARSKTTLRCIESRYIKAFKSGIALLITTSLRAIGRVIDEDGSRTIEGSATASSEIDEQGNRNSQNISSKIQTTRHTRNSIANLKGLIATIRDSTTPGARLHTFTTEKMLLKGRLILHPQEGFVVTWQIVASTGILYSMIIIPFRLGFNYDAIGFWFYFELAIDVSFMFDILLNFRTAYFNEERIMVYNSRIIAIRYLKGWFTLDLLSSIPFDQVVL